MGSSRSEASMRWRLLRNYLLHTQEAEEEEEDLRIISRRPNGSFGLIRCETVDMCPSIRTEGSKEKENVLFKYSLPGPCSTQLILLQRNVDDLGLIDLTLSNKGQIDMTGIVGLWPAEEVLTYYCISNSSIFSNKTVLELGSGYGLAGLAVAACTEAAQVVISDGNPQMIEYVEHNIKRNMGAFGRTQVGSRILCWSKELSSTVDGDFDILVAADCTFFNASHIDLAHTIKSLLKRSREAQVLLFNPRRDGSLSVFLQIAAGLSLHVQLFEEYNDVVWNKHQSLLKERASTWRNYDSEHCYPFLAVLKHSDLMAS